MALKRYNVVDLTKKNNSGKNIYKTVLYPKIPFSENDIYIFGKQNDRLDLLARKYYGDVNMWWIIAHANKIKGTFFLPEDRQLRIPMDINGIITEYEEIN